MAHFAKLDENNVVLDVVVIDNQELLDSNGIEQETLGIQFLTTLFDHNNWKQTSYNGGFRKNYANKGFKYDLTKDAFVSQYPVCSAWVLNEDTCTWEFSDIVNKQVKEQDTK